VLLGPVEGVPGLLEGVPAELTAPGPGPVEAGTEAWCACSVSSLGSTVST